MNTPERKPLKVALSTAPDYRLTDPDFRAIDDFVEKMRKRDREPVFVTHPFAENLDAFRAYADKARLKLHVLDVTPDKGAVIIHPRNVGKAAENARLVVLCVEACLKLGKGGRIAAEAKAADLPVFKFTPKPAEA
jgi:hypothetical protein